MTRRMSLLTGLSVAALWLLLLLLATCQLAPETLSSATPTALGSAVEASSTPQAQEESETRRPVMAPTADVLTITIIYDNYLYDERLKAAWGFAALVEYRDHTLLFDTGGDGPTLLHNMSVLGVDPTRIEGVVLSHIHGDHTGGLGALAAAEVFPTVYLPPSFPASFKREASQAMAVTEVMPGQALSDGVFTTGEMGLDIREQALVIRTGQGLAVLTGCAHPGITHMVARASESFDEPVNLVLGGFHLGSKSEGEVVTILEELRRLGVKRVGPCHCTGDRAIAQFATEYGEDFISAGVGRVIVVGR